MVLTRVYIGHMADRLTVEDHEQIAQHLGEMITTLWQMAEWLENKQVKGGSSKIRNKIKRAHWQLQQVQSDVALDLFDQVGMAGQGIYKTEG